MPPLFVSFEGLKKGIASRGWVVLTLPPITHGALLEKLVECLEEKRGYDKGSVIILNFRRIEEEK